MNKNTEVRLKAKSAVATKVIKQRLGSRGVRVKSLDCEIVVSEFELQSLSSYVHFRTKVKGMKYPHSYGLNSTTIYTQPSRITTSPHVNAHKTEYMCYNQTGDITRRNPSETSWQIHLPTTQCLINQKGHRHAASEGMDIDDMEIRPDR